MSVKITDNRAAYDRLLKELKASGNKEVVAGIQQGPEKDGVQVAEYATLNEFGTSKIPSRPFMRTYFDAGVQALEKFSRNGVTQVALGNATFSQFLNSAGVRMVDGIKKSITGGDWVQNSEYTKAVKTKKHGSPGQPLVDDRSMINNVTFAIHNYGDTKS